MGVHIANVLFPARRLHEPPLFRELNTGADQFLLEYILTSISAHVLSGAGQTANLFYNCGYLNARFMIHNI